ncbi:LacI family DNA-binding transcriptional regulator [Burkholderia multivorans]|uniref:LacI family DNA-binding transcriptional regulator n=1 Tax=Burkholderia multivorans TaxID=87883 RepID=UPI001C239E36|nr:LacI family DNA-binding transcriptional regulator [Burkholderia multivorans]MBU9363455.1 LacI family DNA-binding transcriptional regulator [Burkholderia multivorans]
MTDSLDDGATQPDATARTATLRDVAQLARVSFVTVSRVLNHPDKVSEQTAKRVRAAIRKTGYVPNLLAGGLALQRSRLVIALIPTFAHRPFIDTLTELGDALQKGGYQLLVCQSGYGGENEEALIESILKRRPDAIVLTTPLQSKAGRARLLQHRVPVVETWQLQDAPIDMQVGFDHVAVGHAMGAYVAEKGYGAVGLIWSRDDRAQLRRKGCVAAFEEAGVKVVGVHTAPVPVSVRDGREAARRFLDSRRKPDAIVCSIDLLAHGVLIEAQHRKIAVPKELGIMGFGDLASSADLEPPLTTVHVDAGEIGARTAAVLLGRLSEARSATAAVSSIDVGFRVVARGTA